MRTFEKRLPTLSAGPGRMRRWWLNRPVRTKGIIAIVVPLAALVTVTSASLALQSRERQVRSAAATASALNTAVQRLVFDVVVAGARIRGYAATRNPVFVRQYEAGAAAVTDDLGALRAAATAEGDSGMERTVTLAVTRAMDNQSQVRSAVSSGVTAPELALLLTRGMRSMSTVQVLISDLERRTSATIAARRAEITQKESAIEVISVAGLTTGILAGLTGIVLFSSGISRRVTRVTANADRLGKGQPLVPEPAARDELGRLAGSLVSAEQLLDSRAAELVSARDEAVQASQAKNAFLSSTSHELRTPLNAVLGFTQLLQMSDLNGEDKDAVERILAAGRHLLELINELIDIARIESGGFSLSVEPVEARPVIEESCRLIAPLAASDSISLTQSLPPPGLAVSADRQRLRQILVNLLSNAVKYNRPGGSITVTCHATGPGQVHVAVTDTGAGIQAGDLERVFAPFERLGAEQTAIEGTGIGLPLARALAEAMHGQLTAASVPGKGSTFTLALPRAQEITQAPAGGQPVPLGAAAPGDPAGTGLSILQIEDNPANIEVVSRYLKTRPGIQLRSVTSGQAGLDAAAREVPGLILLDLHLPGLHGEEVLMRLKGNPATAGIPVAVVSAEAAPAIVRRMKGGGAIAYLTKPLDLTALGLLIDTVAAGPGRLAKPTPQEADP